MLTVRKLKACRNTNPTCYCSVTQSPDIPVLRMVQEAYSGPFSPLVSKEKIRLNFLTL